MEQVFHRAGHTCDLDQHSERPAPDNGRTRAVLAAVPDGVITVDEDLVVRTLNPAAELLFGYHAGEAMGLPLNTMIEIGSDADWHEYKGEADDECVAVGCVATGIRRDGYRFLIDLDMSRGHFESGAYFTAVVRDIGDSRSPGKPACKNPAALERVVGAGQFELQQAYDELARARLQLGELAYVASHDLQEPVRMVESYCQLLESRYAHALDDKGKQFLHFALDGALRMKTLIDGLLKFSRVETEAKAPAMVESARIVVEVLHRLGGAVERAHSEINVGPLPRVYADEEQLAEVFFQLLTNALKFRREHQRHSVDVTGEDSGHEWIFTVRDNGVGLKPEHCERIFGLFQCASNRNDSEASGLGLGLSKRIIERHKGRIWVSSEPGYGSAFCFALPKPAADVIDAHGTNSTAPVPTSPLLDAVLGLHKENRA